MTSQLKRQIFVLGLSVAGAGLLLAGSARGQDRPDEGDLFGGPAKTEPAAPTKKVAPEKPSGIRDDAQELGSTDAGRDAFASGEVAENPLQIGGTFYQRMTASAQRGGSAGTTPMSLPMQFDGFLDGRPNERVRGYVKVRLFYDPSRDSQSRSTAGSSFGSQQSASTSTFSLGSTSTNPAVALDQAWLKFDVERAVFITAGKQRVKWGASRYWNPTDLLIPTRRDPTLTFDPRLGAEMVKVEVPWESKKTNFYALALLDNPTAASTLGQVGGAARVETVLGPAEFGVEVIARNANSPVYGADFSSALGPIDVYAEGALLSGPGPAYSLTGPIGSLPDIAALLVVTGRQGPKFQGSFGANYSFAWKENRQATFGLEYFYNELGYDDPSIYPVLMFAGQFQGFYTGRHYAAAYLTAEGPDSNKRTNFILSTIGNLSDRSFISRLDFSWLVLTHLTFEAYADVHYGTSGGEFNFGANLPATSFGGTAISALVIPETGFDLGLGLRVSF